jgi:copper chaperone CopZ
MRTAFEVHGMTCDGCAQTVVRALLHVDGIRDAHASHTDQRVEVESTGPLDEASVRAAIEDAGFDVIGLGT